MHPFNHVSTKFLISLLFLPNIKSCMNIDHQALHNAEYQLNLCNWWQWGRCCITHTTELIHSPATSRTALISYIISMQCHHISVMYLKSPTTTLLFKNLFRLTTNKTSNATLVAFCEGNPPLTGGFPSHRASYAENVPMSLRWRHNDHAGVSNHQPHGCLLNRLFSRKSKKTSKLRVTGLCAGNSPGIGEFPAQMASYAENVSIWWRHHVITSLYNDSPHGHGLTGYTSAAIWVGRGSK